ncbi:hypothetical protein [Micropruina sonneratiae]|uniref:hypothetical protein n=1 Tax=Micropruina sonneratiae TaxID=2986940 RepID=UPI002226AD00|nr:hypothetical protein [Micropruina sp. KQZ13P-5]MCW3156439.1 hypothetical protein [Micropruina sp. KQZ13P-5]
MQQSPAGYVGVDADPAAAALVADVGLARVLRIARNLLRNPGARARVLGMRRVFTRYAAHLTGIALIARKPA